MLNFAVNLLFGLFLSVNFVGISLRNRNNLLKALLFLLANITVQLALYLTFGGTTLASFYPLVTHLPLVLYLFFAYHCDFGLSLGSVMIAYYCTAPRHWLGAVAGAIFPFVEGLPQIVMIAVTVPLEIVPVHGLKGLFEANKRITIGLNSITLSFYLLNYAITAWNMEQAIGSNILSELMTSVGAVAYISYLVFFYREMQKKSEIESVNIALTE